jgi:molybdate/tungstate transport system substrate-binding protein
MRLPAISRAALAAGLALGLLGAPAARAAGTLHLAYAGSMGVVMDRDLGPAFGKAQGATVQGTGQGALALARLIAAGSLHPDVFVSVGPGPIAILQKAGLVDHAVPVASTEMVIAYEPKSRFAKELDAAAAGKADWWKVLTTPGLRFGRTDPRTDPQGQNIIFTMLLAERFYRQPGLATKILGPIVNPAQIFAEPALLTHLDQGQVDASSGYRSAVVSRHLPFVPLPDEINLSDPADKAKWYSKVQFDLTGPDKKTKTVKPAPLVFYAAKLKNAADPALADAFLAYLSSAEGQATFKTDGYDAPKGPAL